MAHFIFEIGFEEFPASFIVPACDQLKEKFNSEFEKARISGGNCRVFSTCSRIAIAFTDMPDSQPDMKEKITGAPKKVALAADGTLSKAGEAFLAKNGIKDYFFENTEKGEVIAGWKEEKGKELKEIIIPVAKNALKNLNFKKSMRWGYNSFTFARPIRWIFMSIDGNSIVETFENIPFSKTSYGHRFLSNGPLTVTALDYCEVLKAHFVIADREERKDLIVKSVNEKSAKLELVANIDENLLEEITDMVEYPHVIIGNIPEKYMHLPVELITKVLKKDQRYFTLCKKGEKLIVQKFASILNNIPSDDALVIKGNEKVVNARLADAAFYFTDDLNKDFNELKNRLTGMLFQKDLGTYHDKVVRIGKIAKFIGEKYFKLDAAALKRLQTASEMVKNDLVTGVVFEFPDLQGIMGKYYAAHAGFEDEISKSMHEHYLPINAGDTLPSTITGTILSMADKTDTIAGGFMAGMKPSGSKDKFAIRRNAIALLTLAIENEKANVNIREIIEFACKLVESHNSSLKYDLNDIMEFITARYNAVLNLDTPVIQAVTATSADIPVLVSRKAGTINKLLADKEIAGLAQLYKRGCNILKKTEAVNGEPDEMLFEQDEERNLYAGTKTVRSEISKLSDNLEIALRIITIKPALDSFFDKVFVMSDNEAVKMNRMKLIATVTTLVTENIGDISYLNI
ncbi:MAG TPA: glycine--tRNA ligase subunit beta [bacterium]|nr:glycine--tRNA ligase subunit beta [bacterium]HPS31038.1 glycine--tRNA ligase subunit beta [bacterium]